MLGLTFDPCVGTADISVAGTSIATGDPIFVLVYTSLFTDARAAQDELPADQKDRRGHWGDALLGVSHGSLLWLLEREKITDDTLKKAKDYADAALAWLVDDGLIQRVDVEVTRVGLSALSLLVKIKRNNGAEDAQRWEF